MVATPRNSDAGSQLKPDESRLEHGLVEAASKSPDGAPNTLLTAAEQRKLIRRIDWRLINITGWLYAISLIDRTNLSAAAVAGMKVDLDMTVGFRYSLVALVFFISYIVFQLPATVFCRKMGPKSFLSTIVLLWGGVMIAFGFVPSWVTLIPLRLLLGVFEGGLFPGAAYLISTWYVRSELQKRFSFFYVNGCLAVALGGILAYGISTLDGAAGLAGWRWIFIIEGVITCALGIGSYFMLIDFPDQMLKSEKLSKFISREECAFIVNRINADRGDSQPEPWNFKKWILTGTDWKIWSYAVMFAFTGIVNYSMSFFLPIILREGMGFSVAAAQCLVAPPYVFGAIYMCIVGWFGDKYGSRGPTVLFNAVVALVGLPVMGFASNNAARYFGVFLVAAGGQTQVPALLAYQAVNITGQWKRAFCSASLVAFGGIGGIGGTLVFRSQDAPGYAPGMIACMACCVGIIVLVVINSWDSLRQNRRADRDGTLIENTAGFRYTL
ncbi:hypothetical protein V2G26_018366 [Clonostachys chloroleuca]